MQILEKKDVNSSKEEKRNGVKCADYLTKQRD